jgi:sigma-B regulation protein RsbU (phosphoserine phosphatase)
MLRKVLDLLFREYQTRRMARFTAWVSAYGAALWIADWLTRAAGGVPWLLWPFFWACATVASAYYLRRLLVFVRNRVLWRLRRRLVAAYVFIAFVPVLLILLLVALGGFLINGQLAAFLVVLRLRERFEEIEQVNRVVLHEARSSGEKSRQVMLDRIQRFYVEELVQHASSYPGLVITLRLGDATRAFLLNGRPGGNPVTIPSWMRGEEFAGIVVDEGHIALRSVERIQTPAGKLTLVLSQPLTAELLDLVGEGIGPVGVVITKSAAPNEPPPAGVSVVTPHGTYVQSGAINSKSVKVPDPVNRLDFSVYGASSLEPISWGGDREEKAVQPAFVYIRSRIFTLNGRLLAALGDYSQFLVYVFKAVAVIFLVIEGVALLIGVRLTRSMTRTVDTLYDATERVKAGDFSYRIQVPAHDQLSSLGEAFDSMTASVERLLVESRERLRMQNELEIAEEVQRQLFPQSAPAVKGLELFGICKAARSVSGDYYDFFPVDEHRVALVLGDVSGKGISAALLMAAIQSALRAQFYDGLGPDHGSKRPEVSTAKVVERLNRQLYANTPLEKYVTFFFAVYDAATRKLSYTNGGHLPPVLFRGDKLERLRTGGTVVGLFPSSSYEEGELQLAPGDLLMAFTDGITEPENIYGEEFGEARVLEVTRRALHAPPATLVEEIYRSVNEWTGSPELQDDMTVVLARAVE